MNRQLSRDETQWPTIFKKLTAASLSIREMITRFCIHVIYIEIWMIKVERDHERGKEDIRIHVTWGAEGTSEGQRDVQRIRRGGSVKTNFEYKCHNETHCLCADQQQMNERNEILKQ